MSNIKFKCKKCGWCCTHLSGDTFVSFEEGKRMQKLAQNLGLDIDIEGTSLRNKVCPFFKKGEGCRIYEDRPSVCKSFPLTPVWVGNECYPLIQERSPCPAVQEIWYQDWEEIPFVDLLGKETVEGWNDLAIEKGWEMAEFHALEVNIILIEDNDHQGTQQGRLNLKIF